MQQEIRAAIAAALGQLGLEPVNFTVEHPADLAHGDYASNAALVAAQAAGKNPRELAAELAQSTTLKIRGVDRVESAGPGFLNFYLSRNFFSEKIAAARAAGSAWGRNSTKQGELVLIEYTSPNLFKPLHIGNLVGNIIGESLTRLFEMNGAEVKRLNYPSDIGLTVAKAVWGMKQTGGDPTEIEALGEAYRYGNAQYDNDEQAKAEIITINQKLYEGSDEDLNLLRDRGIVTSKQQLNSICATLGTIFDREIFESQAAPEGITLVKQHLGEIFEESDGAVVYRGEKVGLHTRVFLNSKGLPTYEAKDLGNFAIKQQIYPNWTRSIIVTGNEQTEYFKVLHAAIREVFPEVRKRTLEHIPTGFLTLTTGKMSSRKGNVLTGESLLMDVEAAAKERAAETRADDINQLATEIATAAVKYQILKSAIGSSIVFDKQKALSFEGDSGPYLQYTHARICSVLEKAAAAGLAPGTEPAPAKPYEIEKLIYRFPEVIQAALQERAPHQVTTYLTALAGAFNTFYGQEQIVDQADEFAPYKLALSDSVRQTLANGLWALGIKAPSKM